MSRRRVFEWYKRFKEGREEAADNERSGRPSTSTTPEKVDKVLELVREDRRITVREVAEEAGILFGSTQSIMKGILGVRKLNAVLVPKDLTFDQNFLFELLDQSVKYEKDVSIENFCCGPRVPPQHRFPHYLLHRRIAEKAITLELIKMGNSYRRNFSELLKLKDVAMAAALQKIDIDPEQQLYTPMIVDIATAVIEMYGEI
ncbi:hypothetical protein LAZ67_10002830 [Cordylochernes scorpioides]|uniref:Uncharacterized protein n=1 Tax=Cordylochernes scorpioides TaxID=51811 RepID=A0ABY6KWV9_9ARAC|nr:hypothetical protein LAZ67_10002830 [Cordylochernes scorpioides]